ncbi:hypothetical protein SELMODRAFT_423996 [Selaginella moellendorffii]|uniref:Uncharacterized protein n=1 Tax=Selaginella moellendorffii TaxID=88036 RepID=D8SNG5_SELML|nr:hypothetical protein SELMODRAFT_423996 [Selaginella moellendorffii]
MDPAAIVARCDEGGKLLCASHHGRWMMGTSEVQVLAAYVWVERLSGSARSILSVVAIETGTLQIRCVLADSRQLLYTDGFPVRNVFNRVICACFNGASNTAQTGGLDMRVIVSKQCTALLLSTKTQRESLLTLLDFKVMEAHAPYVWVWTSMSKMRLQFRNGFKTHEPQVLEIITFPKFGIGQRAFLIQTQEGNILWDCISFLDDATVAIIKSLGGLRAIATSHPHYYSTNSRWSEAFGGVPSGLPARKGEVLLWEGLTLLALHKSSTGLMELKERCFIHWRYLTGGDGQQNSEHNEIVPKVGMDNKIVRIVRSYLNYVPLLSSHTKRIGQVIEPWDFGRLYVAFQDREDDAA